MSSDDFLQALLAAGRGDAPPEGACERALSSLTTAPGGAALLPKLLVVGGLAVLAATTWVAVSHPSSRGEEPRAALPPPPAAPVATPPAPSRRVASGPAGGASVPKPPRLAPLATILPGERATRCAKAGLPVRMIFENNLDIAVDLYWVDQQCEEQRIAHVEAHDAYTGVSYDGSPFRVRNCDTSALLKELPQMSSEPEPATLIIDGSDRPKDGPPRICSPSEPRNTTVDWTWVNDWGAPLDVFWIDPDCHEVLKQTLPPGEETSVASFWAHPWRLRDHATGELVYEHVPHFTPTWSVSVP